MSIAGNCPAPAGVVAQFGGHDGVGRAVDRRLAVVARTEPAAGALHGAAVGVGDVVLRLGIGHAERALEATARGVAVVIVVRVAPAHRGRVERLVACTTANILGVKRAQVQRIDGVADEAGPMSFGRPVLA